MQRDAARRRYNRDILIASAVYGASLILGSIWFRDHPGNSGVLAFLAALVPGLSIVAIFGVIGRYLVEEHDEYQRMLRIRQALIASAVALGLSTLWGFLENYGLAPHLAVFWVAVIWFAGFAIGALINRVIERR
ncbi:hypothetical protein [Sphingomonas adhaesiva]|uniref:hypothetical protein n=1 Tax=Sphingomonas adhaesiva TaxID=28212 RepID=UPI002FF93360